MLTVFQMMKKVIFSLYMLLLFKAPAWSQAFSFSLSGNPVDTTGWTMASQSYVDSDRVILTDPLGNQAGYIYYSTPQNLANCSQFTVTFDFRITNSSVPTADGIAFWYISNPPSAFVTGGGIGLPSDPDGLLLILDTYNNDGFPDNNPLISLRRMDGTSDYTEGTTGGQLVTDLDYQSFITDGNWHTCQLIYSFGTVTVSFDGNPPVMTGTTTLNINGYFGFSAGTGALWAKHAIKNVTITGAPEPDPPATVPVSYCQDEPATPLTAPGNNLKWYTTPAGGTPLPTAPVPSTSVPGTYTWYVSEAIPDCDIESARAPLAVTVHPLPAPPAFMIPVYCSGATGSAIQVISGQQVLWYTADTGGIGSPTPPVISTSTADTQVWYATQTDALGCESPRTTVPIVIHPSPQVAFGFTLGPGCDGDTVFFHNTSTYASAYLWRFNDGYTDTFPDPEHIYADPGSYFVTLTAQNKYCTDSVTHQVTLGHPLEAGFSVSADTLCEGSTVTFTNHSIATTVRDTDPQYQWSFGDGGMSTAENPLHTFTQPGVYSARLIVSNAVPCFDSFTKVLYVDSFPRMHLIVGDTPICKGDRVDLRALLTQNGLVYTGWSFGDAPDTVFNQNPVHHAYDRAGTFPVYFHSHYRVCPDTAAEISIRVKNIPYINLGPDTTLCLDGIPYVIRDNINANSPAASWIWDTGDTTSAIRITHPGHYQARVTIDHCSAADDITVTKDCYLDIPNSFTPNGDGENDYFLPRQLLSKGAIRFHMRIWNRWGETVFETARPDGRGWDGNFNGKPQPVGVYLYTIDVTFTNGRRENYQGNVTLLR